MTTPSLFDFLEPEEPAPSAPSAPAAPPVQSAEPAEPGESPGPVEPAVPPGRGDPTHFDVCGPLPGPGVTVLEASAGTGKTFTIAALVTRFVAEGVAISQVLAVTFTRMATGELRDRVRARLVSTEHGLTRHLRHPGDPPDPDPLVALLAQGSPADVALRRDRLAKALTTFDEATITTTHGFCQLMLSGLGVAGDVATAATLLEDPSDIVEEVVDDLYVRWALARHEPPGFSRAEAMEIARHAVGNADTPIVAEPDGSPADVRRRLATGVRTEVRRRLLEANLLTFDDLLVRLKETLTDPRRGATAAARLRARYSVVLVDEFQDTDPVQWDVVRTAFGTGQTTLVLIGDPKQAIYAFRGADVYAYLDAVRLADRRFTLDENWRSDAGLLAALDALLEPTRMGHPEIRYRPVRAAPAHRRPGLAGAPAAPPLRARLVPSTGAGLQTTRTGVQKDAAVAFVAADLAADVVAQLESGAVQVTYAEDGTERDRRPLGPGDIAVLVGTNRQARVVQQALREADVPSVVAGTESVLATPAAGEWLALLEAAEQPASRSRAVGVALTPFLGLSADQVAAADELEWEQLHARLHRWSAILRRHGVASLFRAVLAAEGVPARLLQTRDGERRLTDLGHIARLLHVEASNGLYGPPALRAWLARRIEDAGAERDGAQAEERSRWIDSDADAVQVLTVHRAKGLEFPVVYCPFLWSDISGRKGRPVAFHDPDDAMGRRLDVAGPDGGADYDRHYQLHHDEERGEALRELYVALTRARHQVVVWWVRSYESNHSPLGRLLTARDDDGNVAPSSPYMPKDEEARARFDGIAARAPGLVGVERADGPGPVPARWSGRHGDAGDLLGIADFDRSLDLRWRRTSYSGITASVHGDAPVGSDPEEPGTTDEPSAGASAELPAVAGAVESAAAPAELRRVRSHWSDLPGGTDMGTFVHQALEEIDFSATDLDAEVARVVGSSRLRPAGDPAVASGLIVALGASITTPLGPLAGGLSLRQLPRNDRLDEMGFELPLAGGDDPAPASAVQTADIARLFDRHLGDRPGGPLAGYGARLADPILGTDLRGYLTGSLDLVLRTPPAADGARRYLVADYKTNRLGDGAEALSAWQYRPAALDLEMQRMHYPLQAVFYLVALHRYLRWRLAGYDPDVHLGGVLYLFLRGMSGPQTPTVDGIPCGVFSWRPPSALITELSDLFETGS